MRRQVLLVVVACGLAACGRNESSAESEATNSALLNEATVDALLGSSVAPEKLPSAGNESEKALLENEAGAPENETN